MVQPIDYSLFDNLKHALEFLSGGKNTVVFDDLGQPSVMVRFPRINFGDVGLSKPAGTPVGEYWEALPAFRCGTSFGALGLVPAIYVGKYLAYISNSRSCSLPYKDPAVSVDFDTAKTNCTNKGTGWHMATNAEWASVAEWSRENGTMPRGNNNYTEDIAEPHESAMPTQSGVVKGSSGTARSYTGTGPSSWNHDNGPFGIADLNGNVWEWVDGLKITAGVATVMQDSSGLHPGNYFSVPEYFWINTGTDITSGMTSGHKILTIRTGNNFTGLGLPASASVSGSAIYGNDSYYFNASSERLPLRGGKWSSGADGGIFSLSLAYARTLASSDVGFRVAFVQ